jgi:hypothetical protein
MPLHGFTAVDLGYQQGNAFSNFINRMDEPAVTRSFIQLFDQIWKNSENVAESQGFPKSFLLFLLS